MKPSQPKPSLASKIKATDAALIVDGKLDKIGEFFTPDYVAHLTDQRPQRE